MNNTKMNLIQVNGCPLFRLAKSDEPIVPVQFKV